MAVVVEADGDVLQLAALVGARDEVLAPVLDPLHLVAESRCRKAFRRPRHEHLLGPGVHDLDAEAAADVGGDRVHAASAAG